MADVKINVKVISDAALAAVKQLGILTDKTTKGFQNLTKGVENVSKAVLNITKAGATLAKPLNDIAKNTSNLFGKFVGAQIAVDALYKIRDAALAVGKSFIDSAINIDGLKSKLATLTGSIQQATAAFEIISKFEDSSPFELEQVAEATKKLLAFGLTVTDLQPTLQVLGDIATASGASLEELSSAFGKVSQTGQLTARELAAFTNNGIPLLSALAKEMGVTEVAAKKLAGEGKVGFDQFSAALSRLNSQGGIAFNAMQKQSETLGGRIKTLGDVFEELKINLGQKLAPVFKVLITTFTEYISKIAEYIQKNVTLKDVVDTVITGVKSLAGVVPTLTGIFKASITPIAALGIAMLDFVIIAANVELGFRKLGALKDIIKGNLETPAVKAVIALEDQITQMVKTQKNLEQLANNSGKYKEKIDDTAKSIENKIVASLKEIDVNKTADADAQVLAFREHERQNALLKQRKENAAEVKRIQDEKLAKEREDEDKRDQERRTKLAEFHKAELEAQAAQDILKETQRITKDGLVTEQEAAAFEKFKFDLEQKILTEQLAEQTRLGNKQKALDLERQIAQNAAKQRLDDAKKAADAQKNVQQTLATQRINIISSSFDLAAALAKDGSKAQFVIQKAAAIAQIALARAQAIAAARAQTIHLLFPANEIAAASLIANANITAALGVATVAATAIKGFEDGGVVGGSSFSGDKVMARVNSGEMVLNRQQQSQLFSMANGAGGSGEQIIQVNNVIELDGEVVARSVSRQVANGLKLGEVV